MMLNSFIFINKHPINKNHIFKKFFHYTFNHIPIAHTPLFIINSTIFQIQKKFSICILEMQKISLINTLYFLCYIDKLFIFFHYYFHLIF